MLDHLQSSEGLSSGVRVALGGLPHSSKYCASALLAENTGSVFRKIGMQERMNGNNHKIMWVIDFEVSTPNL